MTTRIIRQALTVVLLLLFSSENVALASFFEKDSDTTNAHNHGYVQQEAIMLFSILAEENEERDERNDVVLSLEREVLHPFHNPLIAINRISWSTDTNSVVSTVPIYTYHCTLII